MKKKFLIIAAVLVLIIAAGLIFMSSQNSGKNRYALIQTDKGNIKFEIFEKEAPVTSQNFIKLVQSGFYNGLKFHRYEPGFVIQGGDPNGDGSGGSNETIPLEIVPGLNFSKGAVGMARASDPNSASSQFFITLEDSHFLDRSYAVFGKVTEGMDVALSLGAGDVMRKVEIEG
jgi:peptidyl-prolyl cis-trans isomerase B (cyclophilin B)